MPSQQEPTPDHPWERRFIRNMQQLREVRNMSQTDLAKALKDKGLPFHQQTIQRIENGERSVRLNEAHLIAQALDVDLQWMLRPEPSPLNEQLERVRRDLDAANRAAEDAARAAASAAESRMAAMVRVQELRGRLDALIEVARAPEDEKVIATERKRWEGLKLTGEEDEDGVS